MFLFTHACSVGGVMFLFMTVWCVGSDAFLFMDAWVCDGAPFMEFSDDVSCSGMLHDEMC
jgi:hypothetical protein